MAEPNTKPNPWLIAAWPGMGNVAVIAAGYLIKELGMKQVGELPSRGHFDIAEIEVSGGVVTPPQLPKGMFFRYNNPGPGRDIIAFIAESQPATGAYRYAHELLDMALSMGVDRVFTFASIASAMHPSESPKVSGVATSKSALAELAVAEVAALEDGQIGGLNGVLLGAAAARGIQGMGLLAEIPFFAAAVPNPKAARAALSVFTVLAGIDISLQELSNYAAAMDRAILDAMEKMERQGEGSLEAPDEPEIGLAEEEPEATPETAPGPAPESAKERKLDYAARNRIEQLFQEARADKGKAGRLKSELDRLGVYRLYEDRFLDLFRRAE